MALCGYSPMWLWPYVVMALCGLWPYVVYGPMLFMALCCFGPTHLRPYVVTALYSYGPMWLWPYVVMAPCVMALCGYGPIHLRRYVVTALYSYGPMRRGCRAKTGDLCRRRWRTGRQEPQGCLGEGHVPKGTGRDACGELCEGERGRP